MAKVPLKDISEIHTPSFWYDKVSNVEEVYLCGKQFLKFTHMSRSTKRRETVCVASETITKFDYYNKTPELKNRAEVHEAYKNGGLVGY
jgi:hypothetical protein